MGILSNPKHTGKVLHLLTLYKNRISVLLYVAGVIGFIAIADDSLNDGTYFSENALLPGLVDSQYVNAGDAGNFLKSLKHSIKPEAANASDVLRDMVQDQLTSAGLEVYEHAFTFTYPLNLMKNQTVTGRNIYGILRGPRTASTESVVLTTPMRAQLAVAGLTQTHASISLLLGLAKHFRRYTYWAKDVIFLFTELEHIGMQAWLDAYHGSKSSDFIEPGILPAHSGAIQAAINLEFASSTVSYMNIKLEGVNGQLPNLDLVNLVTRLCAKEEIEPRLHHQHDLRGRFGAAERLVHSSKTMLLMMLQQASCMANGNHGLFHRYNIQAVTLEGVKTKSQRSSDLLSIGRVVESIFRSLNNLQERFHQSFFFYLLPSTTRYASIGVYMVPFCLLAAGGIIQAMAIWMKFASALRERDELRSRSSASTKDDVSAEAASKISAEPEAAFKVSAEAEAASAQAAIIKENFTADGRFTDTAAKRLILPESLVQGFGRLLPTILLCHIFGLLVYNAPQFFGNVSAQTRTITAVQSVTYGTSAIILTALLMPHTVVGRPELDDGNWELLKALALLEHGALLLAVGLMNVSLGAIVAIFTVPVFSMLSPAASRVKTFALGFSAMLVSPPALAVFALILHKVLTLDPGANAWSAVMSVLVGLEMSSVYALIDCYMFGSWLFTFASLVLFPNWLMFWSLLWMKD